MHNIFKSNGLSLIWMDCEISIYSNYKLSKLNPAKIDHSSFFLSFYLFLFLFKSNWSLPFFFLSLFLFWLRYEIIKWIWKEIEAHEKKKIILIFHDINGHGCYTYTVFGGLKHPHIFSRKKILKECGWYLLQCRVSISTRVTNTRVFWTRT